MCCYCNLSSCNCEVFLMDFFFLDFVPDGGFFVLEEYVAAEERQKH